MAVLAAIGLFLAACSTGSTGTRDEGPARTDQVGRSSPAPVASQSPRRRVDPVRLVKSDPKVSPQVKRSLKPCGQGKEYPVDVSYGNITAGPRPDIVVNVMTCGDAVGIGAYVYRLAGGQYRNVFTAEAPPVYAEIDRGDLVVTKQVYEKGDPASYPSGEDVITYRWAAGHFAERDRTHNDYSNAVGDGQLAVPSDPSPDDT
ncbi:hypothetical protein [Streptomyces sp. NPDC058045]|uniref:hypothetical protein n=1 Tax=Streptomyces sp. NPDC058045 TaxID=3346311 RepID=UPI0036DFE68F